ncbi:hypothetical protein AVEN_232894-1, partial [Araneus ventricosus]
VVTIEGFGRPSVPTAEKSLVNRPIVVPADVLQTPPWSYSSQNDASVFMTNRFSLCPLFEHLWDVIGHQSSTLPNPKMKRNRAITSTVSA